jgi:hypothetical protein
VTWPLGIYLRSGNQREADPVTGIAVWKGAVGGRERAISIEEGEIVTGAIH